MKLVFVNPSEPHKTVFGECLSDIACQLKFTISFKLRKVFINGKPDTISFSEKFSPFELVNECNKRVIELYKRDYGYSLYILR